MNQPDSSSSAPPVYRQRRYRFRLFLGLALLACATVATAWVIGGVAGNVPGLPGGRGPGLVELGDCARLGVRSIVVVAFCAGVIACATRPIRRGRADYARFAFAQIVLAGLLLAVVMVVYWLFWSPISFLK